MKKLKINYNLGVLFLAVSISYCHGQKDSGHPKTQDLDSTQCKRYRRLASHKIEKDSLYIPVLKYGFSITSLKILETEYRLLQKDFVGGDVIPPEMICFDESMATFIQSKYGKAFFDSISHSSDSLDTIGQGYIESKMVGFPSVEQCFKETFEYKDVLLENKNLMFVVSFNVTPKGEIQNAVFYQGLLSSGQIYELMEAKYKKELERVLGNSGKWEPAKLKGKAMVDKRVVVISHLYLSE